MTGTVHFSWHSDSMTPRLKQAVGHITLIWAMIDHDVTDMCRRYWRHFPDEPISRPFDRRIKNLQEFYCKLYADEYPDEPEEYRQFAWYVQRLKTANGKRDDVAHGQPGLIEKNGRKFEGLMVPEVTKETRYIPMTMDQIEGLGTELSALHVETREVSTALHFAFSAASSHEKHHSQVDGKWTLLTKANRSPKMPKWRPPPASWQP